MRPAHALLLLPLLGCNGEPTDDTQSSFDTALPTCLVEIDNRTLVTLDVVQLFPTDFVGVLTEVDDVPLAVGASTQVTTPVGEYQLKANNIAGRLYFTSSGHRCIEGEDTTIVVRQTDLQVGVIRAENGTDSPVRSIRLASTDDLRWGTNVLSADLDPGDQTQLAVAEGNHYWLAEAVSGPVYFGSTGVRGSEDGIAYASADSEVPPGLCTVSVTNGTPAALDYIVVHDWVRWASNDAVLDSRGPLPVGQVLDILIPTGTWSVRGLEEGTGTQHEVDDVVCEDQALLSLTLE